jgi:sugar phosphate isomerase/epimerase
MRAQQLGVQIHCVRHAARTDWLGTLRAIADLGVAGIELVSFPGCDGNPWGDFGALAHVPAQQLRDAIDSVGLTVTGTMVAEKELAADARAQTFRWVQASGSRSVILTALRPPSTELADWRTLFRRLPDYADAAAQAGLRFVLHTQPELWQPLAGIRPLDLLLDVADPHQMDLELDPTGAFQYGFDPTELWARWTGTIAAAHLRDGRPPPAPTPYLPAEPLGRGVVDWAAFLAAAERHSTPWFHLEMELMTPDAVFPALRDSVAYLRDQGLLRLDGS